MSIPAAKEQSEKNGEREGEQQLTPFSPSSSSSQGWKHVLGIYFSMEGVLSHSVV